MDRLTAMHAFVRLVDLGTFSAVADELRVKQSTVSKWIAALEDELGVQLLARTTRTQRVTDAGRQLYASATDILAAYDDVTARMHSRSPALRGRIRVSAPVVFGRLFVVPAVASFLREHPDIDIDLRLSDRYVNLVDEAVDVAIRVGIPVDSTFRTRTLGEARRHVVASKAYLRRAPPLRTPGDLAHHECLTHTALGAGDVWTFRRKGTAARARVRGRFAANNSDALLAMARRGLGIALLADWLVAADLRRGKLVSLLPSWRPPPAPTCALTPPGRYTPPRVRAFIDHVAASLGD